MSVTTMIGTSFLRNLRYLMIVCGIWQLPYFTSSNVQKIYHCYSLFLHVFFYSVCFLMCLEFFFLLDHDVKEITDNARITISVTLVAIKGYTFQGKKVTKILELIIKNEENAVLQDSKELFTIKVRLVKYIDRFAIGVVLLTETTTFVLVGGTVIGSVTLNDTSVTGRPMMLLAHFPFDQQAHYFLSLLIQGLFVLIASMYFCMSQIFNISVILFVKAQLKSLQHKFKNFDYFKGGDRSDLEHTIWLTKCHQSVIMLVRALNEAMEPLLLLEFSLSSINIATVAFQAISARTLSDGMFCACYLVVLFSQLNLLAWYGNEIYLESMAVSDSVYESSWVNKSIEVKTILRLIILRAQRPLALNIGPFLPLTTYAAIAVIKSAYSFITVMKRTDY
ncbi:odorant receptor 10-like [Euwallacea fornicatus]|uniref:odorant receptor 10-like n=1 Tax=Euwallacea fornicatus TaxID=995702 RepID=UPI00338E337F